MKVLGRVKVKGLSLTCNFNLQTQNPATKIGFQVEVTGIRARSL